METASWRVIATWEFGLHAVQAAAPLLAGGGTALDAAEAAVRAVEAGGYTDTVGLGGKPNRAGDVELDAAVMDGRTLRLGAVAAVRGFPHPVSVARRVMEASGHCLLVGSGAEEFALSEGFARVSCGAKRTVAPRPGDGTELGHDTVCVITLDRQGDMAVATSTSGLAGKRPGRVGDTPLVGSGFYVDNAVGGCAATGVGEAIMRGCLSAKVLHIMATGVEPSLACARALAAFCARVAQPCGANHRTDWGDMSLIALHPSGSWGATSTKKRFPYAVAGEGIAPQVIDWQQD